MYTKNLVNTLFVSGMMGMIMASCSSRQDTCGAYACTQIGYDIDAPVLVSASQYGGDKNAQSLRVEVVHFRAKVLTSNEVVRLLFDSLGYMPLLEKDLHTLKNASPELFPKGKFVVAINRPELLQKDVQGRICVPCVYNGGNDRWLVSHGLYEEAWDKDFYFAVLVPHYKGI